MRMPTLGLFRRTSPDVPLDTTDPATAAEAFADIDVEDIMDEPYIRAAIAVEHAALVGLARSDDALASSHRDREMAVVRYRRAVGADERPAAEPPIIPSFGDPDLDSAYTWANTARAEAAFQAVEDAQLNVAASADATTGRLDEHATAFVADLEQYRTLANQVRRKRGRPALPPLADSLADDLVAAAMRRASGHDANRD